MHACGFFLRHPHAGMFHSMRAGNSPPRWPQSQMRLTWQQQHQPSETNLNDLPSDVATMLISTLSPTGLRSLFCTASMFGRLHTADLVTCLNLSVGRPNLVQLERAGRVPLLTAVKTLDLASKPADYTVLGAQNAQAMLLVIQPHLSTMRQLTRINLCELPFSSVLAAAACLASHPPPCLTTIHIGDVHNDLVIPESSMGQLWQALSGVSTLSSLHLCRMQPLLPMAELSCLVHLKSLQMADICTRLENLPMMAGLTQVRTPSSHLKDAAWHWSCMTWLQ